MKCTVRLLRNGPAFEPRISVDGHLIQQQPGRQLLLGPAIDLSIQRLHSHLRQVVPGKTAEGVISKNLFEDLSAGSRSLLLIMPDAPAREYAAEHLARQWSLSSDTGARISIEIDDAPGSAPADSKNDPDLETVFNALMSLQQKHPSAAWTTVIKAIDSYRGSESQAVRLGFFGTVKAGKSSLLNSLLASVVPDLLPTDAMPCTAAPVFIEFSPDLAKETATLDVVWLSEEKRNSERSRLTRVMAAAAETMDRLKRGEAVPAFRSLFEDAKRRAAQGAQHAFLTASVRLMALERLHDASVGTVALSDLPNALRALASTADPVLLLPGLIGADFFAEARNQAFPTSKELAEALTELPPCGDWAERVTVRLPAARVDARLRLFSLVDAPGFEDADDIRREKAISAIHPEHCEAWVLVTPCAPPQGKQRDELRVVMERSKGEIGIVALSQADRFVSSYFASRLKVCNAIQNTVHGIAGHLLGHKGQMIPVSAMLRTRELGLPSLGPGQSPPGDSFAQEYCGVTALLRCVDHLAQLVFQQRRDSAIRRLKRALSTLLKDIEKQGSATREERVRKLKRKLDSFRGGAVSGSDAEAAARCWTSSEKPKDAEAIHAKAKEVIETSFTVCARDAKGAALKKLSDDVTSQSEDSLSGPRKADLATTFVSPARGGFDKAVKEIESWLIRLDADVLDRNEVREAFELARPKRSVIDTQCVDDYESFWRTLGTCIERMTSTAKGRIKEAVDAGTVALCEFYRHCGGVCVAEFNRQIDAVDSCPEWTSAKVLIAELTRLIASLDGLEARHGRV